MQSDNTNFKEIASVAVCWTWYNDNSIVEQFISHGAQDTKKPFKNEGINSILTYAHFS